MDKILPELLQIFIVCRLKLSLCVADLTVLYIKIVYHIITIFVMVVNSSYVDCKYFGIGFSI